MGLANFLAKYSLPTFNKNRPLRALCRQGYWFLGELYHRFSPLHRRNLSMMENGEILDTYPWPYSDMFFGRCIESEDEIYSAVVDPSGCVTKSVTSYCAYKIKETTGHWPKCESKQRRFDAKDWREFLREAGYWEVDEYPSKNFYYVGIRDSILRPYGEVVWFERYEREPECVLVTTYDQRTFVPKIVRTPDYIWVKIARRELSYAEVKAKARASASSHPAFQ